MYVIYAHACAGAHTHLHVEDVKWSALSLTLLYSLETESLTASGTHHLLPDWCQQTLLYPQGARVNGTKACPAFYVPAGVLMHAQQVFLPTEPPLQSYHHFLIHLKSYCDK